MVDGDIVHRCEVPDKCNVGRAAAVRWVRVLKRAAVQRVVSQGQPTGPLVTVGPEGRTVIVDTGNRDLTVHVRVDHRTTSTAQNARSCTSNLAAYYGDPVVANGRTLPTSGMDLAVFDCERIWPVDIDVAVYDRVAYRHSSRHYDQIVVDDLAVDNCVRRIDCEPSTAVRMWIREDFDRRGRRSGVLSAGPATARTVGSARSVSLFRWARVG